MSRLFAVGNLPAEWRCSFVIAFSLLSAFAFSACGSGQSDESKSTSRTQSAEALFGRVTEASGLVSYQHQTGATGDFWFPESMGPGVGIIDYNADNLPDILVTGGGEWSGTGWRSVWLFRNEGDLRFTDVTDEAGLTTSAAYSMGLVSADYDNDGWEDFLLTSINGVHLFRNIGGQFENVTDASGLSGDEGWSTSASFFDADADGDVDLLIGHYVDWSPEGDLWCSNDGTDKTYCTPTIYTGQPLSFYRNDSGRFVEAASEFGFDAGRGKTLGILAANVVGDWRPEVYVSNDTEPDQLFIVGSNGGYEERGLQAGIAYDERGQSRAGMGIDAGDLDDSGDASLIVGNFTEEMIGVYQRIGEDVFVDRSAATRIGLPSLKSLTFGLALVDVNLDGWLDVVAANGHIQPEIGRIRDNVTYAQPPHVFVNQTSDGSRGVVFKDVVEADSDLSAPMVGRGLAYADLDRDGDVEVVFVENNGGLQLWKSLAVEQGGVGLVVGLRRKTDARVDLSSGASPVIDAQIELYAGGRRLVRSIKSGASYLSTSEPAAHFGLATEYVDSLRVRWPDGTMQVVSGFESKPWLEITKE